MHLFFFSFSETSLISVVTPTKKLPHYVSTSYSDDDDSDNFMASSDSSDDDSLSGLSLLDEASPHKAMHPLKKKTALKKSRDSLNGYTPKSVIFIFSTLFYSFLNTNVLFQIPHFLSFVCVEFCPV